MAIAILSVRCIITGVAHPFCPNFLSIPCTCKPHNKGGRTVIIRQVQGSGPASGMHWFEDNANLAVLASRNGLTAATVGLQLVISRISAFKRKRAKSCRSLSQDLGGQRLRRAGHP